MGVHCLKANFGKRAFAYTFAPILSKTLVIVAQLAPLCQHFFAKYARRPSGGRIILARICAVLFNLIIYRGQKTHTFRGAKFFRRGGMKMRLFAADFAVGGRSFPRERALSADADRRFHAHVSRGKTDADGRENRQGFSRGFRAKFGWISGKIHAVFFIIIYSEFAARAGAFFPPRREVPSAEKRQAHSRTFSRRKNCRAAASRFSADGKSDGARTRGAASRCGRRLCVRLVVDFETGTRCGGWRNVSRETNRVFRGARARNVSCETFFRGKKAAQM